MAETDDKAQKKNKLKAFKVDEQKIRQILNDWDPIVGSPKDEYDCLVYQLLSALHKGVDNAESISSLISYELTHHFGIEESKEKIDAVSKEIINWWVSRKQES